MSIIAHFTSQIHSNSSWRIPFGTFYIAPTIVASLVWLIPESLRYLLSKGREQEARRALRRIRVHNDDESIENEISLVELGLAAHESREQGTYSDLFRGVAARRTFVTIGCCFFLQWSGQALNSNYGIVFVKNLGTFPPFTTIIVACCQLLGTFVAMYLLDTFGRRPMMVVGMTCQCIFMLLIGGMGSIKGSRSAETAVVAFVILFATPYSCGCAPANWVLVAEISDQKLRDKNQVGAWTNIVSE